MPAPTWSMTGGSYASERATVSLADDKNRVSQIHLVADPYATRTPEYWVGIFNVSKTELVVARSWVVGGLIKLAPREEKDLYGKPFILKDIMGIAKPPAGNDEIIVVPTKGEFLAQDICNSNDPYGNWKTYKALNPSTSTNIGSNYYDRGIFWCRLTSPDAEPDLDAVEFAANRLEAYYQGLIEEARALWSGDPAERKFIGKPHHDAANYFDVEEPWHMTMRGSLHDKLAAAKAAIK